MMKHNHLLAAASAVGIADGVLHWPVSVLGLALALPAGLISDLDTPTSSFGRRAGPLPYLIRLVGIRHRTFFHSLPFAAIVFAGLVQLGSLHHWALTRLIAVSVTAGILSHSLLADVYTEHGVEFFWPVPIRLRLAHLHVNSVAERTWVTLLMMAGAVAITAYVGSRFGWALWS